MVVLSTIVSVGTAYFNVLSSQDRLRIARQNLDAANRVLTLIKQRFEAGTASQLDVAQQESLVAQVRATIPLFDQTLRQNIAILAVLIGKPPVQVQIRGGSLYPLAIPRVTPGLPSELLLQRPDIRAAEAALASADANVEVRARRVLSEHLAHRPGRLHRATCSNCCCGRRTRSTISPSTSASRCSTASCWKGSSSWRWGGNSSWSRSTARRSCRASATWRSR